MFCGPPPHMCSMCLGTTVAEAYYMSVYMGVGASERRAIATLRMAQSLTVEYVVNIICQRER